MTIFDFVLILAVLGCVVALFLLGYFLLRRQWGRARRILLALPTGCATRYMYPVKWLYRLLQRSSFSLARDQSYLCLSRSGRTTKDVRTSHF